MAPAAANTPRNRRKRDDQHLAHIGQEGRKTGITVREHERDEEGFEDPGDFFSSASKAPTTARTARRPRKSNDANLGSGDMEIATSPGPSPAETLTNRRAHNAGSIVPQSRSPLKTNIGATPRRPPSSGGQHAKYTPQSAEPGSVTNRTVPLLDFSTGNTRSSSRSALRTSAGSPQRTRPSTPRSNDRNSLSLTPSPERGRRATNVTNDMTGTTIGPDEVKDMGEESNYQADDISPEEAADMGEDTLPGHPGTLDADVDAGYENYDPALLGEVHEEAFEEDVPEPVEPEDTQEGAAASNRGQRARGRPKKTPAATAKKSAPRTTANDPRQAQPRARGPAASSRAGVARAGSSQPLQRPRGETPFEENGVQRTRFGRITYKPLATWKGERVERAFPTGDPDSAFPEIQTILRMEEVTPLKRPKRAATQQNRPAKRKKRTKPTVFEEEEEEDPEDFAESWEADDGIVDGLIRTWNSQTQTSTNILREDSIAYAAAGIRAHDNGEGSFKFAKTLTMPFFGSGIVELPPGGFKRLKNSRKMQMMFFVHYGKVNVRVADNEFSITKGGAWQVPRGNFYSIENETGKPAKIFFSQGCELEADTAG